MNIQDQKFDEASFQKLDLSSPLEFESCEFSHIRFTAEVSFRSSVVSECKFQGCYMANQDLQNAIFRDVHFEGCNLMGINFAVLKCFENCSFKDCKLDLSSFQGRKLKRWKFEDCSLKSVDFSECELIEADFTGSSLNEASFVRADLSKANLRSARSYFIDPTYTKIKGCKFTFPEAASLLVALGAEVEF